MKRYFLKLIKWNKMDNNNKIADKIQNIGGKYNTLNCGGCGVFAVELYEKLKELGGDPKLYILSNYSYNEFEHIRKKLIKDCNILPDLGMYNDYNWYLSHVVVHFDGGWFDSTGVYKSFDELNEGWCCEHHFEIDYSEMKVMVDSPNGWNDMFSRSLIPKLKKDFDTNFNELS